MNVGCHFKTKMNLFKSDILVHGSEVVGASHVMKTCEKINDIQTERPVRNAKQDQKSATLRLKPCIESHRRHKPRQRNVEPSKDNAPIFHGDVHQIATLTKP